MQQRIQQNEHPSLCDLNMTSFQIALFQYYVSTQLRRRPSHYIILVDINTSFSSPNVSTADSRQRMREVNMMCTSVHAQTVQVHSQ